MKINIFWGDLTDISAKKEALVVCDGCTPIWLMPWFALLHVFLSWGEKSVSGPSLMFSKAERLCEVLSTLCESNDVIVSDMSSVSLGVASWRRWRLCVPLTLLCLVFNRFVISFCWLIPLVCAHALVQYFQRFLLCPISSYLVLCHQMCPAPLHRNTGRGLLHGKWSWRGS